MDASDIETALAALCERVRLARDADWVISRGWPDSAALDKLIRAGRVRVTVYPVPGAVRNTTRYPDEERVTAEPAATLTVSRAGDTATFAGDATPAHLAGLHSAHGADTLRCNPGETPATLAARFAALIPGASAAGPAVTVPGLIAARVQCDATAARELRRTERQFAVIVWAPTPALRDTVAAALDVVLSDTPWLANSARMRFSGDRTTDEGQNAGVYRRDLIYSVEYPTTAERSAPRVVFPTETIRAGGIVIRTHTS